MNNWFKRLIGFLLPYTRLPKDPDADLRRIPGYCQRSDIERAACEWPDCADFAVFEGTDCPRVCCRADKKGAAA